MTFRSFMCVYLLRYIINHKKVKDVPKVNKETVKCKSHSVVRDTRRTLPTKFRRKRWSKETLFRSIDSDRETTVYLPRTVTEAARRKYDRSQVYRDKNHVSVFRVTRSAPGLRPLCPSAVTPVNTHCASH